MGYFTITSYVGYVQFGPNDSFMHRSFDQLQVWSSFSEWEQWIKQTKLTITHPKEVTLRPECGNVACEFIFSEKFIDLGKLGAALRDLVENKLLLTHGDALCVWNEATRISPLVVNPAQLDLDRFNGTSYSS